MSAGPSALAAAELAPCVLALVALAAALAAIAIRTPGRAPVRFAAVALAALFVPAAWAGMSELMGRPKPAAIEWLGRGAAEATVLAARLRENEGIYLWLELPGAARPRAYALPWDEAMARQLHKAQADAARHGTAARMRRPFAAEPGRPRAAARDGAPDGPRFYAPAQPGLPPKPPQGGAPVPIR